MGYGTPEQKECGLLPYVNRNSRYRRALNKLTNRLLRRMAKRDPENAPRKKFYNGYQY